MNDGFVLPAAAKEVAFLDSGGDGSAHVIEPLPHADGARCPLLLGCARQRRVGQDELGATRPHTTSAAQLPGSGRKC